MRTARGREVVAIAQEMVPEVEHLIADTLGPRRAETLRQHLVALHNRATRP